MSEHPDTLVCCGFSHLTLPLPYPHYPHNPHRPAPPFVWLEPRRIIGNLEDPIMCRNAIACCVAVLALVAGAGADDQIPAARIVEMKGKATIVEDAGDAGTTVAPDDLARPAAVYHTIYADERLMVADGSQVTLVFRANGHTERIVVPGTFKVTQEGCTPKEGIEQKPLSRKNRATIDKINTDFPRIVQGGVVMAFAPAEGYEPPPPGICPFHNSKLLEVQPAFSWPANPKAKQYTLHLYEVDEEGHRVPGSRDWSDTTEKPELKYADQPLTPGTKYKWEVTASLDGRRKLRSRKEKECWGEFRVASPEERDKAESLAEITAQSEPALIALAAMWYREFGFLREAIALNERLAKLTADPAVYGELEELYFEANDHKRAEAAAEKMMQLEQPEKGKEEGGGGAVSDAKRKI